MEFFFNLCSNIVVFIVECFYIRIDRSVC